jgi:hypothetical protein
MNNNDESNKIRFCLLYFVIIGLFVLVLIVNYLITYDAFSENKVVYLDPNKVCKDYVYRFNKCLSSKKDKVQTVNSTDNETEKSFDIMCSLENEKLLYCFDNLKSFNRRCEIYLSEYYLCSKKKILGGGNKCWDILNDLKACNIWPEYISINSTLLDEAY